jgi:FKBP-type peptidyl-prolyl cis-trans isomerase (trigger factor)
MKSSFVKKPGSKIELEVELSSDEFKTYWNQVFNNALSKVHLKGFRPGQAPKELAAQTIDKEKVFEEAANDTIRQSLDEIIEENNWSLIDSPKITIKNETGSFKYQAELILFPEIELGDYKKIAKKEFQLLTNHRQEVKIEQKEIDNALEFLKKSGANLTNFKDGDTLRKSIGDGLLAEKQNFEKERSRLKILERIAESSKIDVPQVMIDRAKQQSSQLGPDQKITDEKALKDIVNHLMIYKIAQLENLNPTEEELKTQLDYYASRGQKVDNSETYDYIYSITQNRKVFEFLEK